MADGDLVGAGLVPLGCPDCNQHVLVERDRVGAALDKHNDSKHDGRSIAGIAVLDPDENVHFVPHPGDMTDDQYEFVQAVLGGGNGDADTPWKVTD